MLLDHGAWSHSVVGDGTYLNAAAPSMLAEPMEFLIPLDGITFEELMDARLIVEPELAAPRGRPRVGEPDRGVRPFAGADGRRAAAATTNWSRAIFSFIARFSAWRTIECAA